MALTVSPLPDRRRRAAAGGEHPVPGGEQHDAVFTGQLDHGRVRALAPDKDDADKVHHLGGADHLGVDQAGEQQRLILDIGEHIAHQVAAAGVLHLPVAEGRIPPDHLRRKDVDDIGDLHDMVPPIAGHGAPVRARRPVAVVVAVLSIIAGKICFINYLRADAGEDSVSFAQRKRPPLERVPESIVIFQSNCTKIAAFCPPPAASSAKI